MNLKYVVLALILSLFSCKKDNVNGIKIGNTLFVHQTLEENKKLAVLIEKSLESDTQAIYDLINFKTGGGESSYDLGYVLTQIIYRIGEDEFLEFVEGAHWLFLGRIEGLIKVGLAYNYDDNRSLEKEFPKIYNAFKKIPKPLTFELLKKYDISKIIYSELAESGAMGNAGGVIVYVEDNNALLCYTLSYYTNKEDFLKTWSYLFKYQTEYKPEEYPLKESIFNYYYGGAGNHVLINANVKLKESGTNFIYYYNDNKYVIKPSVEGVFNSVSYNINKKKDEELIENCQYWISKNSKWKAAYDDVKYNDSPLIKQNKNSSWKIIFPGSLKLINDTIHVNQELGLENKYYKIEKLNIGDELKIAKSDYYIRYLNKDTIEFNNETFVRVSKTVINGFDN